MLRVVTALALLLFTQTAFAERVPCPRIIVDSKTGAYAKSKPRYRCFTKDRDASRAGYFQASSLNDDSSPQFCFDGQQLPFLFSGNTDVNTPPFVITKSPAILQYNHQGDGTGGFFNVTLRSAITGEYVENLVSHIGPISNQTFIFNHKGTFYLEISARTNYQVSIR